MPSPHELLTNHGIYLKNYSPGRHTLPCPQCSAGRKKKTDPCLSVFITDDGQRAYWKCHHCGWTGPEKGAGGFDFKHDDRIRYWYGDCCKVRNPKGSKFPFFWEHRDADGKMVSGKGKLPDNALYRFDEAKEAGGIIAIVEGEKDVETMWRCGIPATCNAHGAAKKDENQKWTEAHSGRLKGLDIVVLNDNDEPGYAHAAAIIECSRGVVQSMRRVDLKEHWPGDMPEGADVSDFIEQKAGDAELLKQLIAEAEPLDNEQPEKPDETLTAPVDYDSFFFNSEKNNFIYIPTNKSWSGEAVDRRLKKRDRMKASNWIAKAHPVEQMTWAPGEPSIVQEKFLIEGGWIETEGARVYNLYRAAEVKLGDPSQAQPWVDHVHKVYPEHTEHIIRWLAHRCQHPQIKINHALVFGGTQGIGKDTLLDPVKRTIGHWNCHTVTPTILVGKFTGFLKSVLLVVSEARDLGDINRYQFYDHTKDLIAAPPDILQVNEKNAQEYYIPNIVGVIITTNYKAGGIYLPSEDRRHYVCWSTLTPADFPEAYWDEIWGWYDTGGYAHISAFLLRCDLSGFNPKAPPVKTEAFWEMVAASTAPEYADLADVFDNLGWPAAITLEQIINASSTPEEFRDWLKDRKNRTRMPRRFEEVGYVTVRNPDSEQGLWRIGGKKQVAYAKAQLTLRERIEAVRRLGYKP